MEIFSNRKIVQSLLEDFVKEEWVELIDFSSMEATKSVFKGISDSKKESDLLLKFNLKNKEHRKFYIFILMEFQSTSKPMILRLLEYLIRVYRKQKINLKTLYPVIPIVIYNGKKKWSEKNSFIDYFPYIPNKIKRYIPDFEYILIDIARFGDELLETLKDAVSYFFLLDKTDIKEKDKAATRIIWILRELKKADPEIFKLLGRYISGLLKYKGVEIKKINEYISDRGESMLAQSIDELREEGREEGREEERKKQEEIRKYELKQEKLETVKKMLAEGLNIKMISHISGLRISEIEKLNFHR